MKKNYLDNPQPFSQLPFLSLLPAKRRVSEIEMMAPTIHARLETVSALNEGLGEDESDQKRAILAEYTMLKQVLDWLARSKNG